MEEFLGRKNYITKIVNDEIFRFFLAAGSGLLASADPWAPVTALDPAPARGPAAT
jgi:hypothetical protein